MNKKRRSILRRVDKNVWDDLQELTPNMTDPERSRTLFNFSLFHVEHNLKKMRRRRGNEKKNR